MRQEAKRSLVFLAAVAAMFAVNAPSNATDADDSIKPSFEDTYVYKTYLKGDTISVKVKDGVVTLTGTVADQSNKLLAQETVAHLPGVVRVENQLVTDAQVAAKDADTWIGRKVKLTLLFHRNVNFSETTIEVKDGVVTLKGVAANDGQKDLTSEYVKDIDGVKSVKNDMTVAAVPVVAKRSEGQKIDDASISAQVVIALLNHRSTNSINGKVMTRNGEVTLTGIAKSDAEKALVTKLATDIQGVASVNNMMTVEVRNDK